MSKRTGMIVSCCAVSCANRYKKGSGLGFFCFPSDLQRRKAWKKPPDNPNNIDYVPTIFADHEGLRSVAIKRGGE